MLKINSIVHIFPLIIATSTMRAMDMPKQLSNNVISGKLLIADQKSFSKYPQHICGSNPVTCITKENRQTYPYTNAVVRVPVDSPFVHVIIEPNDRSKNKIFTIMPATKLLCLSNKSKLDFSTPDCTFHLTCEKNPALVIEPQYLPKNMQKETFATDLSGSMKKFYTKPTYCKINPNVQELVQHRVLHENQHEILSTTTLFNTYLRTRDTAFLLMSPITISTYTHGENSCSTPKHLIDLATKRTTKPYGKSSFAYVMGRQTGKPISHAQPAKPAENARLTCYYNYLGNLKVVGNKFSMEKTVHFSKNSPLDEINKTATVGDKTLEEEILETEFTKKKTAFNHQPTRKTGDCIVF